MEPTTAKVQPSNFLPCAELASVLLPAYAPCPGFTSICGTMRWIPECGHVPRGFCGALGKLSEVELVLIVAEPGDPHDLESYSSTASARELLGEICRYVYGCFESGKDYFHKNVRSILDRCWPDMPFADQMRRTWITESTLCSAQKEGGTIPASVNRFCADSYLSRQLALLPDATIATLGGKARDRTRHLRYRTIAVSAVAPPGCNFAGARESWDIVAIEVHNRTAVRRGI